MKEKNYNSKSSQSTFRTAIRLFGQLKNQRFRLIVVSISTLFYTVLNVYAPYYSARLMDSLLHATSEAISNGLPFYIGWGALGQELLTMAAIYIFMGLFYCFQGYLMASVAETLIFTLRRQISEKLHKLPLSFFDQNKPGEILSRVTSDLDKVSETLQTGLLKLISAVVTVIGSLSFMFYFSWKLSLVFLAFMVVCLLITQIVAKKNLQCATARQEELATLTGIVEEYYTGRDIIKAFNHEAESIADVENATENVRKTTQKADFLTNCVNPLIRLLVRISQVVILLFACTWVVTGKNGMTFGIAQALFQYVSLCSEPFTQASYMLNSMQSALASAKRTFDFLDGEEEIADSETHTVLKRATGKIAFKNVSFGYSPDKLLMKNISFVAERGQKIAIVGSTGAGKTTLVNLLMRFYEVNGGKITLDDIPTTSLTRKGLRQNFGMVLQDTWLFGGTIAENIAYGKPGATREEIVEAAKMAKVDYFIRTMPNGYDTVLDNDAANLSVGQRQLLTIARVFLCDPPVLILDEATSSVDTRTEAAIGKAMQKLMSRRTSFVIAHRLSTIRDADRILFMENGNIIEQGNHEELLQKDGAYAALYNSQFA